MNSLRHAASLIAIMLLFGPGCQRADRTEEKRVRVALPQWFSPSDKDPWLEKAWQTIREENPGWTVDLETVPGKTEQVLQKLLVVRASGEGPDLACVRLESMPVLVEQGILQPTQATVPAEVWQSMIPALVPGVEWKGGRYVLPYDIGVRVILYRRDLFDSAGVPAPSPSWTWDDLVAGAMKLTRDLDGDGTIDQWGFGVPAARSRKATLQWLPWFWALGGRLQQEDGRIKLCTPAAIEAMQWYRDLAHRYRVTPPTLYAMDQDTIFQGLAGGLFAMTEGGSWERTMLRKYSRYSDKIGIARLPRPRPDASSATLVDGWGFGILTRDPKKLPVLRRVLEHLCSTGHQLAKYRASGMLSPFQPVYEDPEFAKDPDGGVLSAALREARPTPPLASLPSVSEALEIVLQQVLMDGTKPAEALAAQDERLRDKPKRD